MYQPGIEGQGPERLLRHIGAASRLLAATLRCLFTRPPRLRLLVEQLDQLGVKSLSIVGITAVFTGMVMAVQTWYTLGRLGVKYFIGEAVALSIVRELGPVLTALMVGGRVGAGITAELATMAVTEQVDAMRALGASPLQRLVIPRVLATMIMLPLLTVLADVLGILGGLFISVVEVNVSASFYIEHVLDAVSLHDVFSGVGKSLFFGFFIAFIGCYNGLAAGGGAGGVGRMTTSTVVASSIAVLVANFFLTKLFIMF